MQFKKNDSKQTILSMLAKLGFLVAYLCKNVESLNSVGGSV